MKKPSPTRGNKMRPDARTIGASLVPTPAGSSQSVHRIATTQHKIDSSGRDFRPLKEEIVKADARGRLTVGEKASDRQFRILINADGQILLDPVVVIPEREAWLFKNPQAVMSIQRGLAQAEAGELHDLGSFAECADETDEDE